MWNPPMYGSGCQWGTTQFPKGSAPCVPIFTEIPHYDYEWLWLWLLSWYSWLSLTPLLSWISLVTSLIRSVIIHNPISLCSETRPWNSTTLQDRRFFFCAGRTFESCTCSPTRRICLKFLRISHLNVTSNQSLWVRPEILNNFGCVFVDCFSHLRIIKKLKTNEFQGPQATWSCQLFWDTPKVLRRFLNTLQTARLARLAISCSPEMTLGLLLLDAIPGSGEKSTNGTERGCEGCRVDRMIHLSTS